jgi:hypothetical protein
VADETTQRKLVEEAEELESQIRDAQADLDALSFEMLREVAGVDSQRTIRLDRLASNIQVAINPQAEDAPARYIGLENIQPGTGKLSDADEDVEDPLSLKRSFEENDVLYGKLRPRLNKVYRAEAPGMCSTEFLVLRFASIEASAFYSVFMRTARFNDAVLATVTNTMPRTSWEKMRGLQLPELNAGDLGEWFKRLERFQRQTLQLEEKIAKLSVDRSSVAGKYL